MKTRKILALQLCIIIILRLIIPYNVYASAYDDKVNAFINDSRWKNGTYWSNSGGTTPKLSTYGSKGCMAYAADFTKYVYGIDNPKSGTAFKSVNDIRTGDIIWTGGHYFVVLYRNGNNLYTAEGSRSNKVCINSCGYQIINGRLYDCLQSSTKKVAVNFNTGWHYNTGIVQETKTFDFMYFTSGVTISGTYKFWLKQTGYSNNGYTCDVNLDMNGTPIGTIYQDSNGYFSYDLDTTRYANGTYTMGAIIRSTDGSQRNVARTFTIYNELKDTEAPIISNISVSDITKDGYTVNCTIADNKVIGLVQFPTWTDNNGQDDLIWHTYSENMNVSSANISFRVNRSEHNYEFGKYITHIYAWDHNSNQCSYQGDAIVVFLEDEAPIISNVNVTNITNDGYTVYCNITDNNKIERVEFPTWTDNNGQDDLIWHLYSENVNDNSVTAWYRVKTSEHNNEYGMYMTHIYAWDQSHNMTSAAIPDWLNIKLEYDYVPKDIFEYNGNIYAMYDSALTWTEANELCQNMGGHLVTISDQAENDEITKHITAGVYYWIGLNDAANEGNYVWSNGEPFVYNNWNDGEPNDYDGVEEYIQILGNGKWNDNSNATWDRGQLNQQGFILEIEGSSIKLNSAQYFENDKYEFYGNLMPYSVAKYYAESKGGHLVTIESAEENELVRSNFDNWYMWTDLVKEGDNFLWENGDIYGYENWNTEEPNNYQGIETKAVMESGSGKWNDTSDKFGALYCIEYDNAAINLTVTSGKAKSITSNNVVLSGSVKYFNKKPTDFGIQIDIEPPDEYDAEYWAYSGTAYSGDENPINFEYSFKYRKLQPNTTYYWRACAIVDNKRYYGEVKSFKTKQMDEQPQSEFVMGDVSCDGAVAADDATYILQKSLVSTYKLPIEAKTNNWLKYADVSADGKIAADDATIILQKALLNTYKMPVENGVK